MAKDDTDNVSRSSSLSKELDSNESFMKKVSSRVSDLIPTSLSKWFAREEDKSAVRYREDDDDLYSIQPPTKRVKMPTEPSFSYNNFSLSSTPTYHNNVMPKRRVDNLAQTLNFAEPVAGPSGIKARKLSVSKTHQRHNSKEILNGDKDTDSGDSTSGYSSMIKIGSKEQLLDKAEVAKAKEPKTNSLFHNTPAKETNSRTLFQERSLTPQTNSSLSSRRPSFNASSFGSPTFVDRTLSTQRILNSPFYNGRTVYGGASAYGRKLGTTANNLKSPLRNSVQVKPINEKPANDKSALSLTARRILNTLEQYATPVTDAKKIPLPTKKNSQHDGLITKYTGVNPYARASNRELQVPTIPDLLKLKEQLQESTVSVRQMATTSKSELNRKEYKIPMDEKETSKHSNKIKSKVSSVRHKPVDLEETVDQVKLPNVALPMSTLPKFDFSLPPPPSFAKTATQAPKELAKASKTALSSKPFAIGQKETETIIAPKEKPKISDAEYKFSNPLVIAENLKSIISINNFKFSEPILKKTTKAISTSNFKPSDNTEFKIKRVTGRNNGEIQPAPLLAQGSVMDILGKKLTKETVNLLDKFKPQAGSWECSVCLIRNQPDASRCAACETQKSQPKPKSKENKSISHSDFGSQFKLLASMWECTSCLVRNKNEDDKCIACETKKPGSNNATAPSFNSNKLNNNFKPSQDMWECDTCLIRNSNEVDRCAACEARKPGSNPAPPIKSVGFGDAFKKKSDEWECGNCLVKNPNEKLKCLCCETPKPGATVAIDKASSLPKFSFGIDKSTASSFSFGIKPEANKGLGSTSSTGGAISSIFGNAAKPPATSTPAAFVFGINPTSQKPSEATKVEPEPKKQEAEKAVKLPSVEKVEDKVVSQKDNKPVEKVNPVPINFQFMANSTSTSGAVTNVENKISNEKPPPIFSFQDSKKNESPATQGFTFGSASSSANKTESPLFSAKPDLLKSQISITAPVSSSTANAQPVTFGEKPSAMQNHFADVNNSVKPPPPFTFSTPNKEKTEEKSTPFSTPHANTFSGFGNDVSSQFGAVAPKTFGATTQPTQEVKPFAFGSTEKEQPTAKPAIFAFGSKPNDFTQTVKPANTSVNNFGMGGSTQQETPGGFNFGAPKPQTPFAFNSTATFDTAGPLGSNPAAHAQQNGGFNFGSTANNSTVKTGFSFGNVSTSTTNQPATQGIFNFGSANVQATPSGGFNFGSTTAQFSDNVKPMFNFTSGGAPTFSAQPSSTEGAGGPQRKLRKAYRRANR